MTTPPTAPKKPHAITTHGHTRHDDYYWMREKANPEVIAYIEAENSYTEQMMAHTKPLQETLYQEMVGRIQETDRSAPVLVEGHYYYSRTEEGEQYPIYCRRVGSLEADEEVTLDLNALAAEVEYLRMGIYRVSPDHRLLAYSLDTDGAELYTIYIKSLETGELLPDRIPNTAYAAEWANDSRTLFYTIRNEAKRNYKLLRHTLGSSDGEVELFHEADELYRVSVYKSKDRRFLFRESSSIESSEIAFLDADQPDGSFALIRPRQKGHLYTVEHRAGDFYIVTNDDARNFKVMTAPVSHPGYDHWQIHIRHRENVKVDGVETFADHLVVYERANGLRQLRIERFSSDLVHYVDFPEPVYTYQGAPNPEFNTHLLRYTYMSLTTPDSVYDYNMNDGTQELKKRKPVLGGYEPAEYRTERLFATAEDGTEVPISLVYRKDTAISAETPCILYGYGSYGHSTDPTFDDKRVSLLDRGVVFAIAHIRGGQEMGRLWYDQGKFLQKKNTFTDFIACAKQLFAAGYTSPEKLGIWGGSAGGLLVGAVINMAPDLCHSAIAAVPFVDVVTTMLDESIPLTVGEFEEWGNPKDKDYYDYMLSYSPYDNVAAKAYPNLLATSGLNDPRVQYWEPTKWVARLRERKLGDQRLLLKTNMGAGHGGASGRYDFLKERAFDFAFFLDTLGIEG